METTRQSRIARLIQKELSEIFRLQTAKTSNVIVSVSTVRISPDLSIAHVYLSIFPSSQAQQLLQNITRNAKTVRYDLAQRVRFQLRKTPELIFHIDDSLDYIEHIDQLLEEDRKKHPGSNVADDEESQSNEA
ncbi:MAG TPA: 30S ribosome-binding factor RbfA [Candidatus Avimuribaculum pullicola]|nr:30S ribosome-binding factor RbfA [Candidatus Avimuribaculum pullicola]